MRNSFLQKRLLVFAIILFGLISCQNVQNVGADTDTEPHSLSRQFDFWLGEWDVNLRIKQKDNTWKDMYTSIARIYNVLDGNAVLELWEEQGREKGIIGYSIRYYDPSKDKWILWLNWPGANDSSSWKLEGEFRHGRVEFFGNRQMNDSIGGKFRFTFSDIKENSLRWDNALSTDGGKTWAENWIMEFTRKKEEATALVPGTSNLTNRKLNRCDLNEFELIKKLGERKPMFDKNKNIKWYGILDGCAVISVMESEDFEEISILTYNTKRSEYEELVMNTSKRDAQIYYGKKAGDNLELSLEGKPSHYRTITVKSNEFLLKDVKDSNVKEFEFKN